MKKARVGKGSMAEKIVSTIITFIISGSLGYFVSVAKGYKEKLQKKKDNEDLQNQALLTLLKNNLTSTYFIYNEVQQIPDYVYQNFLDELKVYESLGGNGFIHKIANKMESWEIVKTDIL